MNDERRAAGEPAGEPSVTLTNTKDLWKVAAVIGLSCLAGYTTATNPRVAAFTAILVACVLLAHMFKFSTLEILSVLLPVSFVITIGFGLTTKFELNVSVADAVLPLAIVSAMSSRASALMPSHAFTRAALTYAVSLIAVTGISLLVATTTHPSLDFAYGASALLKIAISAGYLLAFYHLARRSIAAGDFRFLAAWTLTASVISGLSIAGYVLYRSGVPTRFTQDYRLIGTFEDPNLFSSYLVISFCFLLMSRVVHPKAWKTVSAIVILASMVLTGSRAVIPAVLAGLLVAVLTARGERVARRQLWRIIALGMFLVVMSFLVWNPITSLESVSRIFTSEDTAVTDARIELWSVAWKMWLEHPVLGVGIGQYQAVADQYVFGGVSNIAHNTYLSFLAETGLVGFAVFMSLPLAIVIRLVRSRRHGNVYAPLLALSLTAVAVQALTLNLENSRALWALLGISAAFGDLAARKVATEESFSRSG